MKYTSLFVVLVLFVLIAPFSLALSDVSVEVVDNKIVQEGDIATFKVTVNNQEDVVQTYNIYYLMGGLEWQVTTAPASDRFLEVGPGQVKVVELTARPLKDFEPGIYSLYPVVFESDRGEMYRQALRVFIGEVTPRQYSASVKMVVDLNDRIDPSQVQTVKVSLSNLNPLDLGNVSFKLESDLAEFNAEQVFSLGGMGKKTVQFDIAPNQFQQPKDYLVYFVLSRANGEVVKVDSRRVEVLPLTPPFESGVSSGRQFLKSTSAISVRNLGNVKNSQQVKVIRGNFFEYLFSLTVPAAQVVEDDGLKFYAWDVSLAPDESVSLEIITNFRLPVFVLLVIIILVVLYFVYRNDVRVNKSASNVRFVEGGVAGLKVTLDVKNTGTKMVKDVEIVDLVPSIADIDKEIEMGTLRPSGIKRKKKGIEITWKLAELEAHEERLVNYKIKSKLNILGEFRLPRARIRYKSMKGKSSKSFSNSFRIGKPEE